MNGIQLNFLDHVAIRVRDMEVSAEWYTKVFGLKRVETEQWGAYPIFMMAGKCGVALFPAVEKDTSLDPNSLNVKIDHFAFNVDRTSFEAAKLHLSELKIEYILKNHFYFESLYVNDPDGHCVELTTILVDETDFYNF